MKTRIIWLVIMVLMVAAWIGERLTLGSFIFLIFVGAVLSGIFSDDDPMKKSTKDVTEELKKRAEEIRKESEEIERASREESERLTATILEAARKRAAERTRERRAREYQQEPQPDPMESIVLNRRSVVLLRNTLMMHHQNKIAVSDYAESKMGKDTDTILKVLNDALARKVIQS